MKNILIVAILVFTVNVYAQQPAKKKMRPHFTPEQIATLQTKKMTLYLQLNESQQQQILEINKKKAIVRKQKMEERKALRLKDEKPTATELFNRKSAWLDAQIAHQKEMKKILTEKQFKMWKKSRIRKNTLIKKRMRKA
ncbi:MAG TPA: hypothetical protein ENK46_03005 [Flavobacteriia bacterium]|jgi:hypothetical protein|nr:hypothetical protein [Flavobacteriia bacterium]